MISVSYTSSDPKLSKEVLETLSQLYLEKHLAVRRAPGTRQFFVEQATQSAKELEAVQGQLREFGEQQWHRVGGRRRRTRSSPRSPNSRA